MDMFSAAGWQHSSLEKIARKDKNNVLDTVSAICTEKSTNIDMYAKVFVHVALTEQFAK